MYYYQYISFCLTSVDHSKHLKIEYTRELEIDEFIISEVYRSLRDLAYCRP